MLSDLGGGAMRRIQQRAAEMREWTAQHPEVAADWDEAWLEDEARERAATAAAAERRRLAEAPDRLLRCGVGELEVDAYRAGLRDTASVRAVRQWLGGDRLILLLFGGAGAGKSVAAALAMLDGSERGCRYVTADWYARLSYYDHASYQPVCEARMLVIDDLGAEQASTTLMASLEGLMVERVRMKRRTIITTNLGPAEFAARYARPESRLASRLHGHGTTAGAGSDDLRRVR